MNTQIETCNHCGTKGCAGDCNKPHFHYGAGLHGYLYQDGPHYAETLQEAVDALADSYELGRTRKAQLKRAMYLELNLKRDGNEYCDITECTCNEDPADYD